MNPYSYMMKELHQMVCYIEGCLDYQVQGLIKCYFLAGLIVPITRKLAIEEQIIVGLWSKTGYFQSLLNAFNDP
jgi:hypothetical protein